MNYGRLSPKSIKSFHTLYLEIENIKPKNEYEISIATKILDQVESLSICRGLRLTSLRSQIPGPIWLPIIFGCIFTLILAAMLEIENMSLHLIISFFLGASISMFLFILVQLDQPFTGQFRLHPVELEQIFLFENWNKTSSQYSPPI